MGSKVNAFYLRSFVVFSDDTKSAKTRVHLLITESQLHSTSVVERMLQILQLIQLLRVKKESLEIVCQVLENNIQAFKNLGFILTIDNQPKLVKDVVIKLLEFTNRTLWAHYGH